MRVALLAIAALVLAGCTGARQKAAENAVAARAGVDDVSCTRTARVGYLQEIPTKVFICIARRAAASCDRYTATLVRKHFVVRLDQRNADCILPAS